MEVYALNEVDKVNYWKEIAEYDLETAKAMLISGRYLYVGFMCHQVIEKILKGYFVYTIKQTPPYTHNLTKISKESGIYNLLSEYQKDMLDSLEPLNIEARYPTSKEHLIKELTKEKCSNIIQETEELYKWIRAKL